MKPNDMQDVIADFDRMTEEAKQRLAEHLMRQLRPEQKTPAQKTRPRKEPKATRGIFEKLEGSGIFWIRYTDGRGRYRREVAGSFSQASKLLGKRRGEALQRRKLPETLRQRTITFSELANDALVYSEHNKKSYHDDKLRMTKLKEWFGSREAESLTTPEIEKRLSDAATAEKWAPSTYNHYRSLMMLVYREARRAGKVSVNPARDVRHRTEDNSRCRFLKSDEEEKLRNIIVVDYPEHLAEFEFALSTGLRKGSMYGLTWPMVDLTAKMMHVPTSKNGQRLDLPLNETARAALRIVHGSGSTSGYVFQSKTGQPLINSRHWFDDAVSKAGLADFHWHDLRHCFASKLRMKGAKLADIAELLGHKTLMMTKRYAHLGPEQLHDVAALLDSISTPVAPEQKPKSAPSASYVN